MLFHLDPLPHGSISCPQREASGKLVETAREGDPQKVLALLALAAPAWAAVRCLWCQEQIAASFSSR